MHKPLSSGARRTAYENGKLCDGGHRFRAAIFMGWDEIWVDYAEPIAALSED